MSHTTQINHELTSISRYLGLITSKYLIFILLIITLYPMNIIPGYILLAGILFPAAFRFACEPGISQKSSKKTSENIPFSKQDSSMILSSTARKYRFTYLKYKAENYNFVLICLLLIVWQNTLIKKSVFAYPVNIIPCFMLIIYILSRFLAKMIFHLKLHHDFMNMNI